MSPLGRSASVALAALCLCQRSTSFAEPSARAADENSSDQHAPAHPAQEKHYWRTALTEALLLGAGTAWYWLDRERQVADWDFPSWRDRLTLDVIRYDNNPFAINFFWHPFNGAGFHDIARVNGLSFGESFAAGLLTSAVWEYALEYREKVSFNDLMYTTGVGTPLGEFLYKMGLYLHDHGEHPIARWALAPAEASMRALDGRPASLLDPPALYGELSISSSAAILSTSSPAGEEEAFGAGLRLQGRFAAIEGYRETGAWSQGFWASEFVRGDVDVTRFAGGWSANIFAESLLAGIYQQQFAPASSKGHEGDFADTSSTVAIALGYRYVDTSVGSFRDDVGVLHFPGLALDGYAAKGGLEFEGRLRLHADFAGINALGYEAWEEANPEVQGKSILRKQGYYYGFGGSAMLEGEARYGDLSFHTSLWAGRYYSDEGLDRVQEDLEVDQSSSDTVLDVRVQVRFSPPAWPLELSFMHRLRRRWGMLDGLGSEAQSDEFFLRVDVPL